MKEIEFFDQKGKPCLFKYNPSNVLGKSGKCTVYIGFFKDKPGKFYAIKIYENNGKNYFGSNPELLREYEIRSQDLKQDVYRKDEYNGEVALVMPYIAGKNLYDKDSFGKDQLDINDPQLKNLSGKERLRLVVEHILAIQFLHSRGIYHKDIKNENILTSVDTHPLSGKKVFNIEVTDFDLSLKIPYDFTKLSDIYKKFNVSATGSPYHYPPEYTVKKRKYIGGAKRDLTSLVPMLLFIFGVYNPFIDKQEAYTINRIKLDGEHKKSSSNFFNQNKANIYKGYYFFFEQNNSTGINEIINILANELTLKIPYNKKHIFEGYNFTTNPNVNKKIKSLIDIFIERLLDENYDTCPDTDEALIFFNSLYNFVQADEQYQFKIKPADLTNNTAKADEIYLHTENKKLFYTVKKRTAHQKFSNDLSTILDAGELIQVEISYQSKFYQKVINNVINNTLDQLTSKQKQAFFKLKTVKKNRLNELSVKNKKNYQAECLAKAALIAAGVWNQEFEITKKIINAKGQQREIPYSFRHFNFSAHIGFCNDINKLTIKQIIENKIQIKKEAEQIISKDLNHTSPNKALENKKFKANDYDNLFEELRLLAKDVYTNEALFQNIQNISSTGDFSTRWALFKTYNGINYFDKTKDILSNKDLILSSIENVEVNEIKKNSIYTLKDLVNFNLKKNYVKFLQKKIKRFDQKSFLNKFKKSSEAKKAAYQGLINFIENNYQHHEKDLNQLLEEAKTKIVVHDIKTDTDILLNKKDLKESDHLCYCLKARLKIDIDNKTNKQIISFEKNIAQAASFDEIICWNRSGGKDDRTVTSRNEIYESQAKVREQIYRIYDIDDQINTLRQLDKNDFEKYSLLGKWAFDHHRYEQALDYFNKFMDMAKSENEDHLQPDKYENATKVYQHALTLSELTDANIEKYKNNLKKAKVLCYFSRLADDKRFFEKTKPELQTIYQAIEMLVEYNMWNETIDGKKKFEEFDFLDISNINFLSTFNQTYFGDLIKNFQSNKNCFDIKKSFIQLDFYDHEKKQFLNNHPEYKDSYTPFHFFYRNYTPQEKLDAVDLLKDTIMLGNSNINVINDFFDNVSNKSAINAMSHGHLGKIAKPLVAYLKNKKLLFDAHKIQI